VRLIVGLGNPGPSYELTRHNLGFLVVDHVAERARVPITDRRFCGLFGQRGDVAWLKPMTFMNLSGRAVAQAVVSLGVEPQDLLVVQDDLDLPFGQLRLRRGGGSGGHRGIASIHAELGWADFYRLKVGIDKPTDGDVIGYVLEPFPPALEARLGDLVGAASQAVEAFVHEGPMRAMNAWNRREPVIELPTPEG